MAKKNLQELYPNVSEATARKVWDKIQEDGENLDFEMLWCILDEVADDICKQARGFEP